MKKYHKISNWSLLGVELQWKLNDGWKWKCKRDRLITTWTITELKFDMSIIYHIVLPEIKCQMPQECLPVKSLIYFGFYKLVRPDVTIFHSFKQSVGKIFMNSHE